MGKKSIFILILVVFSLISAPFLSADSNLSQKLAGYILLQAESNGESWYVSPGDQKRYFLNRPQNAYDIMRNLGIGISNADLNKISIGLIDYDDQDDDNDGLANRLETALGTNQNQADSDNDGYDDKSEIINNYNPLSSEKLLIDSVFAKNNSGKIFLQTESHGEAWYVDPRDQKRYYLGRPSDAFLIMKKLGLGISDSNINEIPIGHIATPQPDPEPLPPMPPVPPPPTPPTCTDCQTNNANQTISGAASAIRSGNTEKILSYFKPELHRAVEAVMDFLRPEDRLILGNILSGSTLSSSSSSEFVYTNQAYFSLGGYDMPLKFHVQKQPDGSWLLTNL